MNLRARVPKPKLLPAPLACVLFRVLLPSTKTHSRDSGKDVVAVAVAGQQHQQQQEEEEQLMMMRRRLSLFVIQSQMRIRPTRIRRNTDPLKEEAVITRESFTKGDSARSSSDPNHGCDECVASVHP